MNRMNMVHHTYLQDFNMVKIESRPQTVKHLKQEVYRTKVRMTASKSSCAEGHF